MGTASVFRDASAADLDDRHARLKGGSGRTITDSHWKRKLRSYRHNTDRTYRSISLTAYGQPVRQACDSINNVEMAQVAGAGNWSTELRHFTGVK